ncbi:MAG: L-dopachrome tautomerase-related protein [Pseudomonadota bacterium]
MKYLSKTLAISLALGVSVLGAASAQELETEIVAQHDTRFGDPFITADGRTFLSMSPLGSSEHRLHELLDDGSLNPYPNDEMSRGFGGVIAARVTDEGVMWILDLGKRVFTGWDINANALVREIVLPDNVLVEHSFLQGYALDQARNRAIIADMSQADLSSAPVPAFIVVDLETGAAQRVAQGHEALMPETDGGLALNPITIDPNYEFVYFGALNGRTIYRVPTASFDGDGSAVARTIERHSEKSFSDGMTIDDAGNIYVADIEANAIGLSTPDGYRTIAPVPEGQSWPDGFAFGPDGFLYFTVNQLNRAAALNNGDDMGNGEYLLMRFEPLAEGTVGR